MTQPNKQISPQRKTAYYIGMGMMAFGFILFLSTFFTTIGTFGNFDNFAERAQSTGMRALLGMVLMIAGGIVMRVGVAGAAGSGLILDPEKARKDFEPWNRMAGGMASDALSEVEPVRRIVDHITRDQPAAAHAVKVRCRQCQALNDEAAKFCNQCGEAV